MFLGKRCTLVAQIHAPARRAERSHRPGTASLPASRVTRRHRPHRAPARAAGASTRRTREESGTCKLLIAWMLLVRKGGFERSQCLFLREHSAKMDCQNVSNRMKWL